MLGSKQAQGGLVGPPSGLPAAAEASYSLWAMRSFLVAR
jgi:hypothetical protein